MELDDPMPSSMALTPMTPAMLPRRTESHYESSSLPILPPHHQHRHSGSVFYPREDHPTPQAFSHFQQTPRVCSTDPSHCGGGGGGISGGPHDTPLRLIKPDPSVFSFSGYVSKTRRSSISSSEPVLVVPTPRTPSKRISTKFVLPMGAPTPGHSIVKPLPKSTEGLQDDEPPSSMKRRPVDAKSSATSLSSLEQNTKSQMLKKLKLLSTPAPKSPFPQQPAAYSHFPNTSPRSPKGQSERQRYTILSSSPTHDHTAMILDRNSSSPLSHKTASNESLHDNMKFSYRKEENEIMPPLFGHRNPYRPITPSTSSPVFTENASSSSSLPSEPATLEHSMMRMVSSPFLSSNPLGLDASDDDQGTDHDSDAKSTTSRDAHIDAHGIDYSQEADYQVVPLNQRSLPWWTSFPHFLDMAYFSSMTQEPSESFSSSSSNANYFSEHFEVADLIGNGSFADVFKVLPRTGTPDAIEYQAIKKTRRPFTGLADRARQLEEPANMWRIGAHPHCLQILAAWEQAGYLYICTEYCAGGSLAALIEKTASHGERFTEDLIWNILLHVALGLRHIHGQGLVHLDLKPDNILVDAQGFLKIADFGLSKSHGKAHDVDMEGDKVYLAPEVLEGSYDVPADVYSLGLVLLELAANIELPSQGDSWQALRSGMFSDLQFPSEFSERLIRLILAMLHPDPYSRPSVESLVQEAYAHVHFIHEIDWSGHHVKEVSPFIEE